MRRLRFYCEQIDAFCVLDEDQSHHLSRVLRLERGHPVELFDGRGTLAQGTVDSVDRRRVKICTTLIKHLAPPQFGRLVMAVSYAKGQRFDWMVEKCTELGADHIAAVQFERTVKLGGENTLQRLRKISLSACKQCGRLFLPELSGPLPFEQGLNALKTCYPDALFYYGEPQANSFSSVRKNWNNRDTVILVGPEGGFSDIERRKMDDKDFQSVSIHSNVLRVETAAVAFCAVAKALDS